jgi:hypothetical protein
MQIELDFLPFQSQLRLTKKGDKAWVFDPVRLKNIVLTPEELLRQLVLCYLMQTKKYPLHRIRVEKGVSLNGMTKRCDIVVFDQQIQPWLLVECKSPKVPLSQATFEQAARYNLALKAPFMAITNGLSTFACALNFEQQTFEYLTEFPEWNNY